jgi:hypothetical protein
MELLKAIRAGRLDDVKAALDAGATLDDEGQPGFALGMACFLGHVDIVRELVERGAQVNLADNAAVTAPLAMAVRGGRKEVVRVLIELGAVLPAGMQSGLSEQEIKAAQWIAYRDGRGKPDNDALPADGEVEEIQITRLSHVDTQVLEAEALRAVLGKD